MQHLATCWSDNLFFPHSGRLVQLATGSTKKHRVVSWFFFSSDIFSLGIQVCHWAFLLPRSGSALQACLGSSQTFWYVACSLLAPVI